MLKIYSKNGDSIEIVSDSLENALPQNVVWVDLENATSEEISYIERTTGLNIPSQSDLSEIESSSRLRSEKGILYLSTPMISRTQSMLPQTTSVGIILAHDILVTVRFARLSSFDTFADELAKGDIVQCNCLGIFIGLVNAITDRLADILESIGAELDQISQTIFHADEKLVTIKDRKPAKASDDLRETLRHIGRCGDLSSKIRDSLLGLGRIVSYVNGVGANQCSTELRSYLETQRHDIASLNDYDQHLANKVQLLLDATMGLINIEQNNIIKVLTVVSVVGVPPTLVASMYGMNFHNMPELSWAWGYPYGLAMIFLSAVLPVLWFKLRGWL